MKDYDKNRELSYWKLNILYGWAMFHKLPLGSF